MKNCRINTNSFLHNFVCKNIAKIRNVVCVFINKRESTSLYIHLRDGKCKRFIAFYYVRRDLFMRHKFNIDFSQVCHNITQEYQNRYELCYLESNRNKLRKKFSRKLFSRKIACSCLTADGLKGNQIQIKVCWQKGLQEKCGE